MTLWRAGSCNPLMLTSAMWEHPTTQAKIQTQNPKYSLCWMCIAFLHYGKVKKNKTIKLNHCSRGLHVYPAPLVLPSYRSHTGHATHLELCEPTPVSQPSAAHTEGGNSPVPSPTTTWIPALWGWPTCKQTKAIPTAETCTTVWLYKTYRKFNGGIFLFLGSKGTWIVFKFHTVTSNHKKEKEDLTWSLLPSLQIGDQTILKMCHSYWADSRKGGKWVLPSIQLGSFKGIIVHRVRHEVSSGMFLSVDILTKLIVFLLRSASLRISGRVKYVQNHLFLSFFLF